MENIVHTFTGLVLAKAGLENYTPLATTTLVIGANLPDIDIVTQLWGGSLAYLQHHRGITHSIVGVAGLTIVLSGIMFLFDKWVRRRRNPNAEPTEFRKLMLISFIGLASHVLLDYTNSYGIRPFLPFSDQRIYGDTFFIVDPWLWIIMGGTLFVLTANTLTKKISWGILAVLMTYPMLAVNVIPYAAKALWIILLALIIVCRSLNMHRLHHKLAVGALVTVFAYWGSLSIAHSVALNRAAGNIGQITSSEILQTISAFPLPVTPLSWRILAETEKYLYHGETSFTKNPDVNWETEPIAKGLTDAISLHAQETCTGRVMMKFARYPFAEIEQSEDGYNVYVRDARYQTDAKSGWGVLSVQLDGNLKEVGRREYCPEPLIY